MAIEQPAGVRPPIADGRPPGSRLACLDAFRGFDILVMIFVNYLAGMAA